MLGGDGWAVGGKESGKGRGDCREDGMGFQEGPTTLSLLSLLDTPSLVHGGQEAGRKKGCQTSGLGPQPIVQHI